MRSRSDSCTDFSTLSIWCDLSDQYFVEEAAHVIKSTLLVGTGFSSRPAGSIPGPRLCKRRISVYNSREELHEVRAAYQLQGLGWAGR